MNCIAHRGFCGVNPENTVPAVEDAAARADAVEVDVRICGSGDLVVCHDETVDRTTDGSGPVSAHTAEELADLSVQGSDAGVPTVEEVVAAIPDGVTLHAELKERGTGEGVERIVDDAACETVVSSFDPEAVSEVEELPTALAVWEGDGAVERAAELGCSFLHVNLDACTSDLVERAHDAGLDVNGWTVRGSGETEALRDAGVDGVMTDFPEYCPSGD
ncbi:glycerophosphodiester phosphodiesterase [Halosimplex aquaticum]|uniref:Glycerophosphodiester phosphodiesterase n=1 Tax=Halosimplex aquaticum TaxID=3026162 RepID=A0ABD5Y9J3_9EURY|nr:glycerophosphodiester phosphodiesterase [Halosimplex aquaticum]